MKDTEKIFTLKTPNGEGYITHGEFMPNDGHKNDYSCWWNGCGIGGHSKKLEDAKKYLTDYAIRNLTQKMDELEEKAADIRIFLRKI